MLEQRFSIRFSHRLLTTRDVFGASNATLASVLDAGGRDRARVAAFVDGGLAAARPELTGALATYLDRHASRVDVPVAPVIVPGGEAIKNDRSALERILTTLDAAGICRRSTVLAVGGGAVLDTVGFAASIAHRGVRLVRVPSTTLSQCDSGVGVKNGINAFGKKNFIGTFAPPWAVVNDLELLTSLPDEPWRSGFSEVVKVALIKDRTLFERVEGAAPAILARDLDTAGPLLEASARLHFDHITEGGDPFELTDSRPLDFGHWAAHRLETVTGYALSHGAAVAIGIALDVAYSERAGLLAPAEGARIRECLEALGFSLYHPALAEPAAVLAGLEEFREHLGGALSIMLLEGIGRPVDVGEIDHGLMIDAMRSLARAA